jgi:Type I restriction enzyme R protein N terminus (HSDR_N)
MSMKTAHPDIVVVSPDGDYLIVVEVKLDDSFSRRQDAIEQLKRLMDSVGCSVGLAITGEHIFLLRDSLEKLHGESINVIGEAKLPDYLLPPADEQWSGKRGLEFELRVQQWLEKLKQTPSLATLPTDLRDLLGEPIIDLLRLGEIRAAGPRWSRVVN